VAYLLTYLFDDEEHWARDI
jgi:hypothetical protein